MKPDAVEGAAVAVPPPPEAVGPFRILRTIDRRGMGVV
jgi:hypothetical protein